MLDKFRKFIYFKKTIAGDHSETPYLTVGGALGLVGSVASRKFKSLFGGLKYDYVMPKPTLKQVIFSQIFFYKISIYNFSSTVRGSYKLDGGEKNSLYY